MEDKTRGRESNGNSWRRSGKRQIRGQIAEIKIKEIFKMKNM